jgi:hypothetical protein
VAYIITYPSLSTSKFGFVKIQSSQNGGEKAAADRDWKGNQYSFTKTQQAIRRGIRSGCDKVFLVVENEEMAKSITGRIEWLSSFGSVIRFDAVSTGVSPNQHKPSGSIPSQQRVPEGEKIRKEDMKEREEKFDKYNRPKEKEQKKIVKKKQKLN